MTFHSRDCAVWWWQHSDTVKYTFIVLEPPVCTCGRAGFNTVPGAPAPPHAPLTKREWIAMAALQGLLSNQNSSGNELDSHFAVRIADALIAELEKKS